MGTAPFCPLVITLFNYATSKIYKESDRLQAHEQVIRPLFNASTEVYVYRGMGKERRSPEGDIIWKAMELKEESILIPQNGKFLFDKTQECITGHEYLWNATWCVRGSIVFVLENDFDFSEIFKHCYTPCLYSNPTAGHNQGAVRFSQKKTEEGAVTALLTASNGIERMKICTPAEKFEEVFNLAESLCKNRDARLYEPFNQIISKG